ncbi:MAG: TolC family protein [Gemmatimonadales bacterium]|nr:TolC family protein [Gemmatimonadales bacterium]
MPSRSTGRCLLLALMTVPAMLPAQDVVAPRQLSLSQALELAKRNSPTYRQNLNDADVAEANVREARGALTPTLSTGAGLSYTGSGRSTFGGSFFNQASPTVSSSYSVDARWSLSARTFMGPSQARAQERATDATIDAAGVNLRFDVTSQYLAALRAAAIVEVAEQQVKRNEDFFVLAKARYDVGQTNLLDVRQVEVTKTRADVQLLQARRSLAEAKIELLRRMGVRSGEEVAAIELTETFTPVEPTMDLAQLRAMAQVQNPTVIAAAATHDAASIGVRAARSDYLPSLALSTGLSGFTQQFTNESALLNNRLSSAISNRGNCEFQNDILRRLSEPHPAPGGGIIADCNEFSGLDGTGAALQPDIADAIRANNSVFPFNFTRQPWSVRLSISLPIWDGFSRSRNLSVARAQEDDAREQIRARQLDVDLQVHYGVLGVRTAWQATLIQETNRAAALSQLQLAQDRYRLGLGSFLEVADAQQAVTQAEADRVTAIYDYHLAAVALEAAVGRPLR